MLIVTAAAQAAPEGLVEAARQLAGTLALAPSGTSGEVAAVDRDGDEWTLYVALGAKAGVRTGQLLDIEAKGEPIRVGDEIVGYRRAARALAQVTAVQSDKLCVAALLRPPGGFTPAVGNVARLRGAPQTLAVAPFTRANGAATTLGAECAQQLGAALLAGGRFQVLDRARLVRGRTEPAQPMDMAVGDGEVMYIERPGDYRIRVLKQR